MPHTHGLNGNGTCVECAAPQLARNNYFTGKLLVERDFREEQDYFLGKDRRHNQELHGWGVVCGLRVTEHPEESCRDRFVVIEPGTAIDCCGREILVDHKEYFDFRHLIPDDWLEVPAGANDPPEHTLQICLRYVDCPTEDVPALFDDCGCDDDACKPNRIRDAYAFELLLDAPPTPGHAHGPRLHRLGTISVDGTWRIALDETNEKLHVLTRAETTDAGGDTTWSWAVTSYSMADQHQVQPTLAGDGRALDLAVPADGSTLVVAVAHAGGDLELQVYGGGAIPDHKLMVAGAGDVESAVLAMAAGGPVYALTYDAAAASSTVNQWNDPTVDGAPDLFVDLGAEGFDLVVTPDGAGVLVAGGGDTLQMLDAADVTNVQSAALDNVPAGRLAVAETTAGLRLLVARTDGTLRVFGIDPGAAEPFPALTGPVSFGADPAVDLVGSADGRFAFVLTRATGSDAGHVVSVDTYLIDTAPATAVRSTVELDGAEELVSSRSGGTLYGAYDDPAGFAGVAVIGVSEQACGDLLAATVEACPSCDDECLVVATITHYVPGKAIVDAQVDNLSDRRLLPSTTVLTDVVRCLLEHGGVAGNRGPQGPPGLGISDVTGEIVNTLAQAGVAFNPATRVVHLKIPKGPQGDPGTAGGAVALDLPHIVALNWPHGGRINPDALFDAEDELIRDDNGDVIPPALLDEGLILGFDRSVISDTITPEAFQVHFRHRETWDGVKELDCTCALPGDASGLGHIAGKAQCGMTLGIVGGGPIHQGDTFYACFRPEGRWTTGDYVVVFEGDFVLGADLIQLPSGATVNPAVDANHLGPGLPKRCPTGNGTEGGTFRSWFHLDLG